MKREIIFVSAFLIAGCNGSRGPTESILFSEIMTNVGTVSTVVREKEGIYKEKVKYGMTRDALLLALGPPVEFRKIDKETVGLEFPGIINPLINVGEEAIVYREKLGEPLVLAGAVSDSGKIRKYYITPLFVAVFILDERGSLKTAHYLSNINDRYEL